MNDDLSVLRMYREPGASYLTSTYVRSKDWADSDTDQPTHHGLPPFGVAVVLELNRPGMLVDLSCVSATTMRAAIAASRAPAKFFSHSGVRVVDDHTRKVPDDVLKPVAMNGGVVIVNFADIYVLDNTGAGRRSSWPRRRCLALRPM